jgi:hypothetical protein
MFSLSAFVGRGIVADGARLRGPRCVRCRGRYGPAKKWHAQFMKLA